jgi:hypothetical protein
MDVITGKVVRAPGAELPERKEHLPPIALEEPGVGYVTWA